MFLNFYLTAQRDNDIFHFDNDNCQNDKESRQIKGGMLMALTLFVILSAALCLLGRARVSQKSK